MTAEVIRQGLPTSRILQRRLVGTLMIEGSLTGPPLGTPQ